MYTKDIYPGEIFLTEAQQRMIDMMLDTLNKIEAYHGKKINIASGLRTLADYNRLKAGGYNPSRTSDHFYGLMPFTAGAVDFFTDGTANLFYDLYGKRKNGRIILPNGEFQVGQMILEKNKTHWIHIANPRRLFDPKAPLPKQMFLRSDDNGKTYRLP